MYFNILCSCSREIEAQKAIGRNLALRFTPVVGGLDAGIAPQSEGVNALGVSRALKNSQKNGNHLKSYTCNNKNTVCAHRGSIAAVRPINDNPIRRRRMKNASEEQKHKTHEARVPAKPPRSIKIGAADQVRFNG